jgi:hypothetical protein
MSPGWTPFGAVLCANRETLLTSRRSESFKRRIFTLYRMEIDTDRPAWSNFTPFSAATFINLTYNRR